MSFEEEEENDFIDDPNTQHIRKSVVHIPDDGTMNFSFRKLWLFTGPGFLMSIAYIDPGNLESDLQAGAVAGYQLGWVVWWSTLVGLILQLLSVRLGVITGLNLAQMCRKQYSKPVRYLLWVMMEIAIIASDIQEVLGSAIAISVLSDGRVELYQGAIITAVDTFLFLFLEQYGLRKLEAFFASLITVMSVTFGYMYVVHPPDQLEVLKGVVIPICDSNAFPAAIGVVGAIIMPHNLYLHSALVLSRDIDFSNKKKIKEANYYYAIEASIALFVSFLINLFVVAVFADAFYNQVNEGIPCSFHDITSTDDIDLLCSADVLYAKFGSAIKYIWAIGLLAAGQSSTMTGTYAGQFVMEGFLKLKIAPWKRVTLTRMMAMVPTLGVALAAKGATLNNMNEYLNVLQSVQLPFALLPVLHFTSIPGIMGEFVNGPVLKFSGWFFSLLILGINTYLVFTTIAAIGSVWYWDLLIAIVCVFYFIFVLYLAVGPFLWFGSLKGMYGRTMRAQHQLSLQATKSADNEPLLSDH